MTTVNIILAHARGVIGADGGIPWRLPEDMEHFRKTTMGCPVIMGRRTWDSIPARFKPLSGRRNIVMTRDPAWHHDGASAASSMLHALQYCAQGETAWVIGGGEIYQQAMSFASGAVVTELDLEVAGSIYVPSFGPGWTEVARRRHTGTCGTKYSIVHLAKQAG